MLIACPLRKRRTSPLHGLAVKMSWIELRLSGSSSAPFDKLIMIGTRRKRLGSYIRDPVSRLGEGGLAGGFGPLATAMS